jgi:tail protein
MITLADLTYQFTDTGMLLNGNHQVIPFVDIESISGLDTPEARVIEQDRDGAHGAFIYTRFYKHRAVALDMTLYATGSTLDAELNKLKANFIRTDMVGAFYFKHPGSSQKVIFAKALGLRYSINPSWAIGIQPCSVILLAADPRIYDANPTTVVSRFEGFEVLGRNYPKTYPYVYGQEILDAIAPIYNAGTIETYFQLYIYGPVNTPRVTHEQTGKFIELNTSVAAGQVLSINFASAHVYLGTGRDPLGTGGGSTDVTYTMTNDSRWLYASVGQNTYRCTALDTDVGSKLEFTFRSAWL